MLPVFTLLHGVMGGLAASLTDLVTNDDDPGTATNGVLFLNDGTWEERFTGSTFRVHTSSVPDEWYVGDTTASIGDFFEVRCASISVGSWSNAAEATGTWVAIDVTREWNVSSSDVAKQCVAVFEIGLLGTSAAIASCQVDATADGGEA